MKTAWISWRVMAAICCAATFGGCDTWNQATVDGATASDEQAGGTLRLPLVTPEQASFRLRNARFEITNLAGSRTLSLDSDADPDATELSAELAQDSYEITLQEGWILEAIADGGTSAVNAALLTPNPTGFAIEHGQVTELVYAFTTDTGIVTLGQGNLSITVSVVGPELLANCDVLNPSSCPGGQTCLLAGESGDTFCATPGSLPVGAPCSSEQCVAGAQCLGLDSEHPDQRVCTDFCDPATPFGCECRSLSANIDVGICVSGTSNEPDSCRTIGGVRWCFNPNACGEACNDVCASIGLPLTISNQDWFDAQDTFEECQAINAAFGLPDGVQLNSFNFACIESSGGDTAPGGIAGPLLCSTLPDCPANHRTDMDGLGIACENGGRRSLCPCQ